MSTVHIFVGQCGNQLGTSFLNAIAQEAEESASYDYQTTISANHFRPALKQQHKKKAVKAPLQGPPIDTKLPQPRCVMVDMEPKVIQEMVSRNNTATGDHTPLYSLEPQQCVMRGSGSGNNWAYGYLCQGESCRESIAECLRRESEASDATVTSFHALHSVAGGTGSGVGCVVAEVVKDMFPSASLLHTLVWPFDSGEVVTQWYNIVLSLSTLRDVVDGAYITFNDEVANQLKGRHTNRGMPEKAEVDFAAMNDYISRQLTSLYLPQLLYSVPAPRRFVKTAFQKEMTGEPPSPQRYVVNEDIIEALSLDPAKKFFVGHSFPRLNHGLTNWAAVLEETSRAARRSFSSSPSALYVDADRPLFGWNSPATCLWSLRGFQCKSVGLLELQNLLAVNQENPFPISSVFASPVENAKTH
ncbi:tubulin delta [Angomonas deanei]|nr:tubulin delta [Angomonas deanei]|eukprot:EPY36702.1 tubulin delta [Angomonas deanei]